MSAPADFLVEIGTEELPPKALRALMEAFAMRLAANIDEARLEHGDVQSFASPRRYTPMATSTNATARMMPVMYALSGHVWHCCHLRVLGLMFWISGIFVPEIL